MTRFAATLALVAAILALIWIGKRFGASDPFAEPQPEDDAPYDDAYTGGLARAALDFHGEGR